MKKILMAVTVCLTCVLMSCETIIHRPIDTVTNLNKQILVGESNEYFWYLDGVGPNITTHALIFKFLDSGNLIEITVGWPGYSNNCIYYGEDEIPIKDVKIHNYELKSSTTHFEGIYESYLRIDNKAYKIEFTNNNTEFVINRYSSPFHINMTDYYQYPTLKLFIDSLVNIYQ